MFADFEPVWPERPLKHLNGAVGIGIAAHEDIEGRKAGFRPGVHTDVRFRENRDALVAQTMMKEGLKLAEAQERIDLILDLSRFLKDASFVVEESRASQKVVLDMVLAPVGE